MTSIVKWLLEHSVHIVGQFRQVFEIIGGEYRNRTGVHGFAIRCVTTPPTRRSLGFIMFY